MVEVVGSIPVSRSFFFIVIFCFLNFHSFYTKKTFYKKFFYEQKRKIQYYWEEKKYTNNIVRLISHVFSHPRPLRLVEHSPHFLIKDKQVILTLSYLNNSNHQDNPTDPSKKSVTKNIIKKR